MNNDFYNNLDENVLPELQCRAVCLELTLPPPYNETVFTLKASATKHRDTQSLNFFKIESAMGVLNFQKRHLENLKIRNLLSFSIHLPPAIQLDLFDFRCKLELAGDDSLNVTDEVSFWVIANSLVRRVIERTTTPMITDPEFVKRQNELTGGLVATVQEYEDIYYD